MPRYFASFQEKGDSDIAITPLRPRIAEVEKDVARPRVLTGKEITNGTLVLIFRRTRKNPVIHGIYKWADGLVRMGDKNLALRLQALMIEE
jgi:hypothetical protein